VNEMMLNTQVSGDGVHFRQTETLQSKLNNY